MRDASLTIGSELGEDVLLKKLTYKRPTAEFNE